MNSDISKQLINYFNLNNIVHDEINDEQLLIDIYNLFILNKLPDTIDDKNNDILYMYVGLYHQIHKNFEPMKENYLKAIKLGNTDAMRRMGSFYEEQKDYKNMIKCYLMAIEKNDSHSMFSLGLYYEEKKDYEKMIKYYLMAIEKDETAAMFNLGLL